MKKEMKTELTKEKIIKASMKEFGANGYAGASLNNICETGISKGLIYHNFESKDAIYLACIQKCFDELTDYLRKQNIGSDFRGYLNARLCFFKEHQDEARLFFEALLQPPTQFKEQILNYRKEFDKLNNDFYQQMLSGVTLRDEVTKEDAMMYFSLIQNMFNGYFNSFVCEDITYEDMIAIHEKSISKVLDFMLYGIAERG